jgi:outer membrane protein assembly factor BamB
VEGATGKSLVKEDGRAYMFSSPAVVNDTVFIGVLNGTLVARDAAIGKVLWEFQTDASKENKGRVLTAEGRFNVPMLFFDNWREGPLVAQDRQISVGSIFSSPLVANGIVYFGSTDGFMYAIE